MAYDPVIFQGYSETDIEVHTPLPSHTLSDDIEEMAQYIIEEEIVYRIEHNAGHTINKFHSLPSYKVSPHQAASRDRGRAKAVLAITANNRKGLLL